MTGLLALLGLGVAGVGATSLAAAAGQHPTQAQVTAAGQREQAVLWERLSAGGFPVVGQLHDHAGHGHEGRARRHRAAGAVPRRRGRQGGTRPGGGELRDLLRATYADASGTALATIGIAVLPSPAAAAKAMGKLAVSGGGLLPLGFPGTVASVFTSKARETYASQAVEGPYLFLYAAGYADGRLTMLSGRPGRVHGGDRHDRPGHQPRDPLAQHVPGPREPVPRQGHPVLAAVPRS